MVLEFLPLSPIKVERVGLYRKVWVHFLWIPAARSATRSDGLCLSCRGYLPGFVARKGPHSSVVGRDLPK